MADEIAHPLRRVVRPFERVAIPIVSVEKHEPVRHEAMHLLEMLLVDGLGLVCIRSASRSTLPRPSPRFCSILFCDAITSRGRAA